MSLCHSIKHYSLMEYSCEAGGLRNMIIIKEARWKIVTTKINFRVFLGSLDQSTL